MGVWKDKASKTWKYVFQYRGKIYGGGGFKTKAEAIAAREEKKEQIKTAPTYRINTTRMGFCEAANLYLDFCQRRHAPKTYKYKKYVFAEFIKKIGDLPLEAITPFHIREYLNTRPSNYNYNKHRTELFALFSYCRKNFGIPQVNPCEAVERLPVDKKPKKIPTKEEFLKILMAANEEQRQLLMVLACTMARIDEVLRLRWQDVNFEKEYLTLYTKKNREGSYRGRDIPMNNVLKNVLYGMWANRVQDEWVFFNAETGTRYNRRPKMMPGLCKRAGVPNYGFHAIRHFVSSYLYDQEKIGKATIGKILGHQSITTTDIYIHSLDEALKEAVHRVDKVLLPATSLPATSCGFDVIEGQMVQQGAN